MLGTLLWCIVSGGQHHHIGLYLFVLFGKTCKSLNTLAMRAVGFSLLEPQPWFLLGSALHIQEFKNTNAVCPSQLPIYITIAIMVLLFRFVLDLLFRAEFILTCLYPCFGASPSAASISAIPNLILDNIVMVMQACTLVGCTFATSRYSLQYLVCCHESQYSVEC